MQQYLTAPRRPATSAAAVWQDLRRLHEQTLGDPEVCVAVLDGPADLTHACLRGSRVRRGPTLVADAAGAGAMSAHGTHVASVIFGQPGSPVHGVAPGCRGVVLPIFREGQEGRLSQLDLARALEQAVEYGANVVNVSGGQRVERGEPEGVLARALQFCRDSGVLVVAATGNDGCPCLHVPAAVGTALAVGAADAAGAPLESSNWGETYRSNGVLAPGKDIPGAVPGEAVARFTGSSFATPIVAGLAALLASLQRQRTGDVDTWAVRRAILDSALPCTPEGSPECDRYLVGMLNVAGATALVRRGGERGVTAVDQGQPLISANRAAAETQAPPGPGVTPSAAPEGVQAAEASALPAVVPTGAEMEAVQQPGTALALTPAAGVAPACACGGADLSGGAGGSIEAVVQSADATPTPVPVPVPVAPRHTAPLPLAAVPVTPVSNIYAIGNIGFDFGTEARRDTFRASMDDIVDQNLSPPVNYAANPYDTTQLADYLDRNPWESNRLIWTLNLDLTPVYAIEAEAQYADVVYERLRQALRLQSLSPDAADYVSRFSLPGVMLSRTTRLYSGQEVPVVVAQPRGMWLWREEALVDLVVNSINTTDANADTDRVRRTVRQMLDKVYYQLRNLGQTSPDRAVNFMATNAFNFTFAITEGLLSGSYALSDIDALWTMDNITASKSSFCRVDSDCWDVQISFFDPTNDRQARVVFQTTVDVSDQLPVQLAPTRQFLFSPWSSLGR
jgi:cyanobactin maturation PatA/PatG family protease